MELINYKPEHFLLMDLQASQKHILAEAASPADYAEWVYHRTLFAKTLVVDNNVIAIIAVHPTGPESGELMSLLSSRMREPAFQKKYGAGFRAAKQYVEALDIYRLEARVTPRDAGQRRLVTFLGFEYEATLEGAGIYRSNVDVYKRINKWTS